MEPSADSTARIHGARAPHEGPDRTDDAPASSVEEPGGATTRRWTFRRVAKITAAVVVVLAFLLLGDRWAVLYAEKVAAQKVQEELGLHAEPEVHVDSFPFVAQLAAGRLDRVEATVPHVPAGRVSVAKVEGTVDDLRIVGNLPNSVKGAVLSELRGEVFLDFDDLNREVGASQVQLTPGRQKNTVRAHGEMPVAGTQAEIRARAHMERTGDHGVAMAVADTRIVVPGLLTYTPGEGGGLQLAAPAADKMDDSDFEQATGEPLSPGQLMKGSALDALTEHPELLKPAGIDPSLIRGLQKVQEPKVAKELQFSARLPDSMPGDIRLRDISVEKDGVRAELTGSDVPLGDDVE